MDITLTMLNFSEDQLKNYLVEIKKSNLPKEVQWELADLLETANEQIGQAKAIGWLR
jgi:phospholipase C